MRAQVGDRLVIKGHRIYENDRDAEILEVRGPSGGPPYRVRWSEDGRETLIFPGSDAQVQSLQHGTKPPLDPSVPALGKHARDLTGAPTVSEDLAVSLVRRHLALEQVRTTDFDSALWAAWREEVARASNADHNLDVLERVVERARQGQ